MHLNISRTNENTVPRQVVESWIQSEYNVTILLKSIGKVMAHFGFKYVRGNSVGKILANKH